MSHGLLDDLILNRSLDQLVFQDLDQFPASSSSSARRKLAIEEACC